MSTACRVLFMVVPVCVGEIAPREVRGRMVLAFGAVGIPTGVLVRTYVHTLIMFIVFNYNLLYNYPHTHTYVCTHTAYTHTHTYTHTTYTHNFMSKSLMYLRMYTYVLTYLPTYVHACVCSLGLWLTWCWRVMTLAGGW